MRLVLALGLAVAAFVPAPASATCMPWIDRYGVEAGTCSPPGGPAWTYVCVGGNCVYYSPPSPLTPPEDPS